VIRIHSSNVVFSLVKYGADELRIYEKEEYLPNYKGSYNNSVKVIAPYGYVLTWHTAEDDIHLAGDGQGSYPFTAITVDEPTYIPRSIKKLKQALKCRDHIEANRTKYYHKPTLVKK